MVIKIIEIDQWGVKTPLYNLQGNALVFLDMEHAEFFVKEHQSVLESNIEYRQSNFGEEDLYKPYNVWEYEENFRKEGKRYC